MALPPKVKTWQYAVNQLISAANWNENGRVTILAIKNSMVGFASNPWVPWGSSNESGLFGNNDGVDRWTTTADIGSGNRWIVLENLVTGMQVCFYMYNGTGTGYVRIFVSPLGGFGAPASGGTGTDGAAATPPTAADQWTAFNGAFTHSTTLTFKLHVMHSSDGECTRVVTTTSSICGLLWLFDAPSNPITPWTTPMAVCTGNGSSSATTYAALNDVAPMITRIGSDNIGMYVTCEGATSQMVGEWLTSQDDDTGEWPIMPMGLLSTTGSHRGRKGSVYDLWWGSTAVAVGTAFPDDLTYQFVQLGHVIFPWNGVAPEVS